MIPDRIKLVFILFDKFSPVPLLNWVGCVTSVIAIVNIWKLACNGDIYESSMLVSGNKKLL